MGQLALIKSNTYQAYQTDEGGENEMPKVLFFFYFISAHNFDGAADDHVLGSMVSDVRHDLKRCERKGENGV